VLELSKRALRAMSLASERVNSPLAMFSPRILVSFVGDYGTSANASLAWMTAR
jgi:hypothetical protein